MAVILIASYRPKAGKTSIAAGLTRLIARSGATAAGCKPLSPAGDADADAVYFARNFRGRVSVASAEDEAGLDAATSAVRSLTNSSEHIVVEAPPPADGPGIVSPAIQRLAEGLSARVVAVFGYDAGLSAMSVTSSVSTLGDRLAGVIINQVPRYRKQQVADILAEVAAAGVPVNAALPEERAMLSLTMAQLAEELGGRWELEPSDDEDWVDRFLIGGNIMDSGAGYFGRYSHQAVITRAERPDIQMASLMQATRCLVLTGGARPTEYIRVEARKRAVPVLLVDRGTAATADAVGSLLDAAVPYLPHKAELMADLLESRLDLSVLLS